MVEIDNERKSKELEYARELQLSVLPKEVPRLEGLDISCFMKTATEVGGDYYDFFVSEKQSLTVAVGDATGHDLRAGNMVIATKGLLNVLSERNELDDILTTANRAIKNMKPHMLTMCLAMLRIQEDRLSYSSAGMPPLMIYRQQSNRVEQFVLKAMPLGAAYDFPYKRIETGLSRGDALLMISDGLMELFNPGGEPLGMVNVAQTLEKHAHRPPAEIVQCLFDADMTWSEGARLSDDVTMVGIKVLT
jgi:serine phosphatase RsbU (regulator of sigma subunit)